MKRFYVVYDCLCLILHAANCHVLDMIRHSGGMRQVAAILPYVLNRGGAFIFIVLLIISLYHHCYMSTKLEFSLSLREDIVV